MLYACSAPERQVPQPTKGQQAMIDRKYGMFLHFGMNTYLNVEWSDGTALASTYAPPADMAEKSGRMGEKCKACRNEIHYTDNQTP